jgi:hypothetical protein
VLLYRLIVECLATRVNPEATLSAFLFRNGQPVWRFCLNLDSFSGQSEGLVAAAMWRMLSGPVRIVPLLFTALCSIARWGIYCLFSFRFCSLAIDEK